MKGRRCTEKLALVPGGKLGYNKATQAKDLRWKKDVQMELFRRTLAGLLMLVVAVSVGIWVQGKFIDAVRLPTHTRVIGATYTTLSDPFYETINDEIQMQIKSNGDLLLVRDPGKTRSGRIRRSRICSIRALSCSS